VRKNAFESALKNGKMPEDTGGGDGGGVNGVGFRWSAADARDLEEAVELERRGLVFWGVKQ